MLAIANKSVDARISVAKVRTLPVRTGEPFSGYASGGFPAGFSPHPKDAQALDLRPARQGRPDDRPGNRAGSGAMPQTVEPAAWLASCSRRSRTVMKPAQTPKQHQRDQEEGHEQEHAHMNGHTNPRG